MHDGGLKAVRQRGSHAPSHMAAEVYLRELDAELDRIRVLLYDVWSQIDKSRDFNKCSLHLDRAQQRMHKMLKKLAKMERGI